MGKDNRNRGGFKIPESVTQMTKMEFERFKKKLKKEGYYDGKKECRKAYNAELLDLLPETIWVLVRYGHLKEVQEIKDSLYAKLTDPDNVKYISKMVDKEVDIENIELLPIVLRDIIHIAKVQEAEDKKNDPNAGEIDVTDIRDLSMLILKSKIKKMVKKGIDPDVAFDCLSVIPTKKVLEDNQINYKLRILMNVLYEHAKTKELDFDTIIKALIPDKYIAKVVLFCLLERKDKFAQFNENQQKFFISINEWIFNLMEDQDKSLIETILNAYIEIRKRDAGNNRDSARRYFIKSLPESDYPNITKVVKRMIEADGDIEKFF